MIIFHLNSVYVQSKMTLLSYLIWCDVKKGVTLVESMYFWHKILIEVVNRLVLKKVWSMLNQSNLSQKF